MLVRLPFAWACAASLVAGCAPAERPPPASLRQLESRASFDLWCYPQWMQLRRLDERTIGVVGCGKHATYVEQCEATCSWRLEPAPTPFPAPPATPPAPVASPAPAASPVAPGAPGLPVTKNPYEPDVGY